MPEVSMKFALIAAPFVGSFLGVLILRLPLGESVILGRSRCDHCAHVLVARDLVPILSWLATQGRCRYCASGVGAFYPGIELAALAIAVWSAWALPVWLVWAGCALGWSLLALAIIDQRHFILPDELTLPLIPAGVLVGYVIDPETVTHRLLGAALGFSLFALTREIYGRLRGREGLGLGDAKLMAAAGAWLSWQGLPSVVLLATLAALFAVAVGAIMGRRTSPTDHVAFGPFICLAIWIVWLFGPLQFGPIELFEHA